MKGRQCKFEELFDFEQYKKNIPSPTLNHEQSLEEKINDLEHLIRMKDNEIERVNWIINESTITLYDGADFDIADSTSDSNETGETKFSDDESTLKQLKFTLCDFKTEHKNGLQIYVGKQHKFKCDECEIEFEQTQTI